MLLVPSEPDPRLARLTLDLSKTSGTDAGHVGQIISHSRVENIWASMPQEELGIKKSPLISSRCYQENHQGNDDDDEDKHWS